jgi:SAM-dependent methyltransferase
VSVGALQTASTRSCLKDLHRILRPGGRLVFVEPMNDFKLLENTAFEEVFYDEEVGDKRKHKFVMKLRHLHLRF